MRFIKIKGSKIDPPKLTPVHFTSQDRPAARGLTDGLWTARQLVCCARATPVRVNKIRHLGYSILERIKVKIMKILSGYELAPTVQRSVRTSLIFQSPQANYSSIVTNKVIKRSIVTWRSSSPSWGHSRQCKQLRGS